jgi:hypothetical protein
MYPNYYPAQAIKGPLNLGGANPLTAPGGFIGRSVGLSNRPGLPWFVDTVNGSDSWDGTVPVRLTGTTTGPFKTILAALAVAGPYAVIFVALGVYDEGGPLNITQLGLKLIGMMTSGDMWGQPSIKGLSVASTLINVKANSVEIAGIGFTQNSADKIISVSEDAWGLSTWRTHVHHCFFGGNQIATFGVWYGGVGTDAPFVITEDCEFYDCVVGIRSNAASVVQRNKFNVMTGGVGVQDIPNTSSRPGRWYLSNKFRCLDGVNGVGISVVNTPDPGQILIDDNHFAGFADPAHACDVVGSGKTGLMGLNYNGKDVMNVS